jgi:hypothetical protein
MVVALRVFGIHRGRNMNGRTPLRAFRDSLKQDKPRKEGPKKAA